MDELLDLTEKTPRTISETEPVGLLDNDIDGPVTLPIPVFSPEIPPLSVDRAAEGTRSTRIAGSSPPVPARRASTVPPPIPPAALRKVVVVESPAVAPPVESGSVEVELSEPTGDRELVSPTVEAEYNPPSVLPPLPAPSASWLSQPSRRAPTQPPPPMRRAPTQPPMPYAQAPMPYEHTPMPYEQTPMPYEQTPMPYAPPQQAYAPSMPYAQLTPYAQPYGQPMMPMADGDSTATSWYARASREWTARHFAVVSIVAIALVSILYVAFSGDHATASTPVAQTQAVAQPAADPAPVTAPVVAPVVEPARPVVTSVPITSVPVGAVVTLVTDGNATVLGKTPVTASIDPAHNYDVVLAVRGQPTQIRHIDANTHEIAVDMAPRPVAAPRARPAPPQVQASPPAPVHHAVEAPRPVRVAAVAPSAPSPTTGGVLSLTTKPSCEIFVDGVAMHMVTPQRSMALSSGRHMITLTNSTLKIKKTIAVQIDPRKPTTISQDFTH